MVDPFVMLEALSERWKPHERMSISTKRFVFYLILCENIIISAKATAWRTQAPYRGRNCPPPTAAGKSSKGLFFVDFFIASRRAYQDWSL